MGRTMGFQWVRFPQCSTLRDDDLEAQENRTLYRYSRVGVVAQFIIIAFASKYWHGLRRVDLTAVLQDHHKKTRKTRVTVTVKLTIHKTSTLSKLTH